MVLQPILPVRIKQEGGETVTTYALMDQGSTISIISEAMKKKLNVKFHRTQLKLKTVNRAEMVATSLIKDLVVTDQQGCNAIKIKKAFSREDIPVEREQIPNRDLLNKWPCLQELAKKLPEYHPDLEVGLLIGNDCPEALCPHDAISTREGPFATRYKLGWTVSGPIAIKSREKGVNCHRILVQEVSKASEMMAPSGFLDQFNLDFSELDKGQVPDQKSLSRDDLKFLQLVGEGMMFKNGRYEVPLPIRE